MKVWVVTYSTESGDRGILGVWKTKPTAKAIDQTAKKISPLDWKCGTIYTAAAIQADVL